MTVRMLNRDFWDCGNILLNLINDLCFISDLTTQWMKPYHYLTLCIKPISVQKKSLKLILMYVEICLIFSTGWAKWPSTISWKDHYFPTCGSVPGLSFQIHLSICLFPCRQSMSKLLQLCIKVLLPSRVVLLPYPFLRVHWYSWPFACFIHILESACQFPHNSIPNCWELLGGHVCMSLHTSYLYLYVEA